MMTRSKTRSQHSSPATAAVSVQNSARASAEVVAGTAATSSLANDDESVKYTQLVVWPGVTLEHDDGADLVKFMKNKNFRVRYETTVTTLPDATGPGGRSDVFFYIHSDDCGRFSAAKLQIGARWWEDIFHNHCQHVYPVAFLNSHPPKW